MLRTVHMSLNSYFRLATNPYLSTLRNITPSPPATSNPKSLNPYPSNSLMMLLELADAQHNPLLRMRVSGLGFRLLFNSSLLGGCSAISPAECLFSADHPGFPLVYSWATSGYVGNG